MGFSTGTDPVIDSTTLGLIAKVMELGTKITKKHVKMLGRVYLSDRM